MTTRYEALFVNTASTALLVSAAEECLADTDSKVLCEAFCDGDQDECPLCVDGCNCMYMEDVRVFLEEHPDVLDAMVGTPQHAANMMADYKICLYEACRVCNPVCPYFGVCPYYKSDDPIPPSLTSDVLYDLLNEEMFMDNLKDVRAAFVKRGVFPE